MVITQSASEHKTGPCSIQTREEKGSPLAAIKLCPYFFLQESTPVREMPRLQKKILSCKLC